MVEFKVELSAPGSTIPARGLREAIPLLLEQGVKSIIDVGCGLLRNTPLLLEHFERVWIVDTEVQYARIKERLKSLPNHDEKLQPFISSKDFSETRLEADAAVLISVLHILPYVIERFELIKSIERNLCEGGFLLIDSPGTDTHYQNNVGDDRRFGDGFYVRRQPPHTFTKVMQVDELRTYATANGMLFRQRVRHGGRNRTLLFKKEETVASNVYPDNLEKEDA